MEYNTCSWCGANEGRAGLLINESGNIDGAMCLNCYDTKKSGNVVINACLRRTQKELNKTMELATNDNDKLQDWYCEADPMTNGARKMKQGKI